MEPRIRKNTMGGNHGWGKTRWGGRGMRRDPGDSPAGLAGPQPFSG